MIRHRFSHLCSRIRPAARRLLIGLMWTVVTVLVVVTAALLIPAGREALLDRGLRLAGGALPAGTLQVDSALWPSLGHLTLAGVRWRDGETLLASLDSLAVTVDLSELRRRDLVIRDLWLSGARLDVPEVQKRLPDTPADSSLAGAPTASGPPAFPRPGSLPPVPSLALQVVDVQRVSVTVSPEQTVHLDTLRAGIELRRDHSPAARLDLSARPWRNLGLAWRGELSTRGDTLAVLTSPITVTLADSLPAVARLPLGGRLEVLQSDLATWSDALDDPPYVSLRQVALDGLAGRWVLDGQLTPDRRGRLDLAGVCPAIPWTLVPDSLRATAWADTLDAHWRASGAPSLDLSAVLSPATGGRLPWDVALQADLVLPGPAALKPLLPPQLDLAGLTRLAADLQAEYVGGQARVHLDLSRSPWLETAVIAAHGDTARAVLDSLAVALPGLAATARGGLAGQEFELDAQVVVPDARLLRRWREPALADLELTGQVDLRADGRLTSPRAHLQLQAATPDAAVSFAGRFAASDLDRSPHLAARLDSLAVQSAGHRFHTTGPCSVTVAAADSSVMVRGLAMAGDLGTLDLDAAASPGSLAAALGLDLRVAAEVLQPWLTPDGERYVPAATMLLTGTARVQGSPDAPVVEGDLRLGFADNPDLERLAAEIRGGLDQHLAADIAILDADTTLAHLLVRAPRPWPEARPDTLDVTLLADGVDLHRLQPLLPAGVTATGTLRANPRLTGILDPGADALPDLALSGNLEVAGLQLDLPDGLWLDMQGRAGFAGSTAAPEVQASLRLEGQLLEGADGKAGVLPGTTRSLLLQKNQQNGAAPSAMTDRPDGLAADARVVNQGAPSRTGDVALRLGGQFTAHGLDQAPRVVGRLDSLAVRAADRWLRTGAPCTLMVDAADSSLVVHGLAMSGDLGRLDLETEVARDRLSAALGLDLKVALEALQPFLGPQIEPYLPRGTVLLAGRTTVQGTMAEPVADGRIQLGFADNPGLSRLSADAAVSLQEHLAADIRLRDTTDDVLRVRARLPRPGPAARPDTLDVTLLAERADLSRLQPLLPTGVALAGTLSADPRLVGMLDPNTTMAPDLDLSGRLELSRLRLSLPDGSWLAMAGQAGFSGSTLSPVVQGGLSIDGGLLRVPGSTTVLLPEKGKALLWRELPQLEAQQASAAATADSSSTPGPTILPELDLRLLAPGGLWIRGQGLDVELAGDLNVRLKGGLPALEGELQAVGGTMRQLGHVFKLERGRVIFYADETNLDPELDLALTTKVDGVAMSILLTGTAKQPRLDLTSDADLSHGDIMALLLFGKTADELDDGQAGFLAQRAAQLAAASGSVALQERLARELGADVLTIAPSEGRDDATALTLGKYISPRVLVRYEQLLSKESAFYVHLDYSLLQSLKLHTQVSQGEASGAALRWEKDW